MSSHNVPRVEDRHHHRHHVLPVPFVRSSTPLTPLAQGAEALVFRTTFLTPQTPCVLKYRPPKPYRHPTLDKRLTKARVLAEARVLVRCLRDGVPVPAVLGGDWEAGWLIMEWIEGATIRAMLDAWMVHTREEKNEKEGIERSPLWQLMARVGQAVGRLHKIGVCHGDLTTSNLMVRTAGDSSPESMPADQPLLNAARRTPSAQHEAALLESDAPIASTASSLSTFGAVVLIDFGLATQTVQDEDRAVDLYVLERAFAATHPAAEPLFREVLRAYSESYKGAKVVLKRLEDVRMRGRKRSMLG